MKITIKEFNKLSAKKQREIIDEQREYVNYLELIYNGLELDETQGLRFATFWDAREKGKSMHKGNNKFAVYAKKVWSKI